MRSVVAALCVVLARASAATRAQASLIMVMNGTVRLRLADAPVATIRLNHVRFTAVPEPSSAMVIVLGLAMTAFRKRP